MSKLIQSLSPSELRAIEFKSQGYSRAQTAVQMGVGADHVKNLWQRVRRKARAIGIVPPVITLQPTTVRVGQLSTLHQV